MQIYVLSLSEVILGFYVSWGIVRLHQYTTVLHSAYVETRQKLSFVGHSLQK